MEFFFPQVSAETVTEVGDPKAAICDAVQKYNINFLVLGARGVGKLRRLVSSNQEKLNKAKSLIICSFTKMKLARD